MWLLDANMDVHVASFLRECSVPVDVAGPRGWGMLANGELVATAAGAGFTCLLTQDRLFAESASAALPWRQYLEQFRAAWAKVPIRPVPGQVLHWPGGAA